MTWRLALPGHVQARRFAARHLWEGKRAAHAAPFLSSTLLDNISIRLIWPEDLNAYGVGGDLFASRLAKLAVTTDVSFDLLKPAETDRVTSMAGCAAETEWKETTNC